MKRPGAFFAVAPGDSIALSPLAYRRFWAAAIVIGWAASDRVEVTMPYDATRDTWLGRVPMSEVTLVRLTAGQVVLLYPGDAHAPRRAASCPAQVRKIVAKVAIPRELVGPSARAGQNPTWRT